MNKSYNYCKMCSIKIPRIFSDIHLNECHGKNKQPNCFRLHPLVKDGVLVSRITIIRDSELESSKREKSGNWLVAEEPKFMNYFEYEFTERFVFMNELDMFHSKIEAFSHVCVCIGPIPVTFIAVPENSEKQQIGTILFYEKGLKKYFPKSEQYSFVIIKRIDTVLEAKKVRLSSSVLVDESLIRHRFKKLFHSSYEFGFPFLFRKVGDKVKLRNLTGKEFDVKITIEDNDPFNFSIGSTITIPVESTILNATTISLSNLSVTEKCKASSEDLEIKLTLNASKKSFRSSTPTFEENNSPSKVSDDSYESKDDSLILEDILNDPDYRSQPPTFYWLSNNTKIEIKKQKHYDKNMKGQSSTESYKDTQTQNLQQQNWEFYETKEFFILKELITRKLEMKLESVIPHISWGGILLLGLPGTGKTAIVEQLSKSLKIPLIAVNILEYTRSGRSENYIDESFAKAQNCAPSILFFDGFECFAQRSQSKFSDKILKALKKSKSLEKPVIFIGASNCPDLISSHMRQAGRFDKDVILSLPDAETRAGILEKILEGQNCNITQGDVVSLGKKFLGFSPADIDLSVRTAWQKTVRNDQSKSKEMDKDFCLQKEHLEEGIKEVVPSHLRDKYLSVSKVNWQDIWGYETVKEKLKKVSNMLSTEKCSKGILFYGPPGCSKTMMARALATETQFSFFPIKCSDLLSKYVGETEKALCDMFEKATLSSPSLVFIDEIDSLCGRQDGGVGTESSVVPEMLSLMRKSYTSGNILFVGATNRPHVLDESLLSAGYFELLFHVDLPDCASRCAIWSGLLNFVPHNNVNILTLCGRTEGFSCAEICSIYQKAAYSMIELRVSGLCDGDEAVKDLKLTEKQILKTISSKSPRTSKSVLESIETFARGRTINSS